MYVQGVSTRKVTEITQELCGLDVSSSQVSRCAQLLDEELQSWRSRPLGQTLLSDPGCPLWKSTPKRWIVERTFAWLARYRRSSKDYEKTVESSEAFAYIAMISLMSNRLAKAEIWISKHVLKAARKGVFPGVPKLAEVDEEWQTGKTYLNTEADW